MKYRQTAKIQLGRKTIVTDPCYDPEYIKSGGQGLLRTLPGEWICDCSYDEKEGNIRALRIKHESISDKEYTCDKLRLENFSTDVDSGLAGFFDMEYFENIKSSEDERKDRWYEKVCKSAYKTVKNERLKLSDNYDIMHIISRLRTNFVDGKISRKNYTDIDRAVIGKHMNDSYISTEILQILEKQGCDFDKNAENVDSDIITKHISDICSICNDITDKDFYAFNHERKVNDAISIDNKGYVSTTAYGDGSYSCYTHKDKNGNVVYIKLIYELTDSEFVREFKNDITKNISEHEDKDIEAFLDVDLSTARNKKKVIKDAIKNKALDDIIDFCTQTESNMTPTIT